MAIQVIAAQVIAAEVATVAHLDTPEDQKSDSSIFMSSTLEELSPHSVVTLMVNPVQRERGRL